MTGATPSGSGCQPTASAADASSQSGIPSADVAWGYRDLVACLQRLHSTLGVHTIEGRLKNVKFLGLMPQSRTGRGVAYNYSESDVLFLALLTEMGQMGFSPTKAVNMMDASGWLSKWQSDDAAYFPMEGTASHIVLDYARIADAIRTARPQPKPEPRTRDVIDIRPRIAARAKPQKAAEPDYSARPLADDLLQGVNAASDYTGIGRRTLYNWVETSSIPFTRVGKLLFFRKSELDAAFSPGGDA